MAFQEKQWWLKEVIDGIWEFSDKIIVIDGSPSGSSTDGTIEYLKCLDENKVAWATGTFKNLWEQKNVAMKFGLTFDPDYFMTVDADEILDQTDLKKLRTYIEIEDAPPVIMFKMWHTWKDFKHHQVGGPFSNPFIRLFKAVPGIHYDPPPAGDEPKDAENRYLKIHDYYVSKTKFLPEPITFHVGHSKNIAHEVLKIMRYAKWESAPIEQFLWRIEKNTWLDDKNPEPLLSDEIQAKFKDFDNPCEGCPKSRHLIDYCFNKCPIAKKCNFQYENFMYEEITKDNIKDLLEKYGIKQEGR